MGIVTYCPNGHRVKVKDELAGRKGICPQCAARFRVPLADGVAARTVAHYPVARVVSLDPAVAARLPRAVARASGAADAQAEPAAAPPEAMPRADLRIEQNSEPLAPDANGSPSWGSQAPPATSLHPLLAERPELTWRVAVPGGEPSAPMSAEAMQSFLDAGGLTGAELVWREGWPDWVSFGLVFPDRCP